MAEDAPEPRPIPAATPDADGAAAAEIVDGLQTAPATATEDAIEAFGADIYQRARSAFARGDIMLALGVVTILVILILPMPRWLLDVSLAFSITFSVLVLMTVIFMDIHQRIDNKNQLITTINIFKTEIN